MQITRDEVFLRPTVASLVLDTAVFNVRWDIQTFIENELDDSKDLGQVLTLTGGCSHAYAARCADNVKWQLEDCTYGIHEDFQQFLKQGTYEHSDSTLLIERLPGEKSGIKVTLVGTRKTITEVAEQLGWLTSAFRSSSIGAALSDVNFFAVRRIEFVIEPRWFITLPSHITEEAPCWHRLVRNAVIATGFPIPLRTGQFGLELPLGVIVSLSRANTFAMANRRPALYGFSSLLFPTDYYGPENAQDQTAPGPSIQWHFKTSSGPDQYFDSAHYLAESGCIWSNAVDQGAMTMCRHFVGSSLPDASTRMGVKIETIIAGTSGLGFATAEAQSTIIYTRSIFTLVLPDEYLGTMDTVQRMSMILWDTSDQCGWLVPVQALLLHMAHLWVYQKNIFPTFRYVDQGASSYLDQVDDILRTDRRKVIEPKGRDDDTDLELRHLIIRF
ncbi:hypothetical protein BJX99DRAFT_259698 [Aspergillus californicus]